MTYLKNYVILVVGCIFLSTFVQTALPDSSLKKTLRFVLGLILGVIIITPFAQFSRSGNGFSLPETSAKPVLSAEKQKEMESLVESQTQTLFQQTLEQTIISTIVQHGGPADIQVSVDCGANGELNSVTIFSQDRTLPTLISQNFDIPLQKIHLSAPKSE